MYPIRLFAVVVTAFFLSAPAMADSLSAFSGKTGIIRIAGGTAHIPVMKEAAKQIMKNAPGVKISIAGGGSGVGIKKVGEGLVAIGNSGRKPTNREIKDYGLVLHKWAVDGVGVVVHPDNSVADLSTETLQKIFSGAIKNWKAAGGPDLPITLYTRDAASGTRSVFWKKALKKGAISDTANFIPSNGAMKTAIAKDKGAIGYVSVGHMDSTIKGVAINGVAPTLEAVKSGAYPVARGLFSNTKGEPEPLVAAFLDFLYTKEGQKIIQSKGFIPVNR